MREFTLNSTCFNRQKTKPDPPAPPLIIPMDADTGSNTHFNS